MAFIRIPGVMGRVYVPDAAGARKHGCKDCFCCQWCSDERCRLCRKRKSQECQRACRKKRKKT